MKLDKTVAKTPARGPRTTGAFPRYVAIGNAKKVWRSVAWDRYFGQVVADEDEDGNLIGIRIEEG
jgi:hypothetical protein